MIHVLISLMHGTLLAPAANWEVDAVASFQQPACPERVVSALCESRPTACKSQTPQLIYTIVVDDESCPFRLSLDHVERKIELNGRAPPVKRAEITMFVLILLCVWRVNTYY